VLASKFGADSSLLALPINVKLGCWRPVALGLVELLELELEGRRSIQGTATCFPPLELAELPELDEPDVSPPPADPEEEDDDPELGLEVPWPDELPLVLVAEPLLDELSDTIANSILPEPGLMISSLIVPSVWPEELVTFAPVNWLARISWWPIMPPI